MNKIQAVLPQVLTVLAMITMGINMDQSPASMPEVPASQEDAANQKLASASNARAMDECRVYVSDVDMTRSIPYYQLAESTPIIFAQAVSRSR